MERGARWPWGALSRLVPALLALALVLHPLGGAEIVARAPEAKQIDKADRADRPNRGDQDGQGGRGDEGGQGGPERSQDDGENRQSRGGNGDQRDRNEPAAREDPNGKEETSGADDARGRDECTEGNATDANCDKPRDEDDRPAERETDRNPPSDRERSPRPDEDAGNGRSPGGGSDADGASEESDPAAEERRPNRDEAADRSEERRRSRPGEDRPEPFPTVIKPFDPPPAGFQPVARIDVGALRPAATDRAADEAERWTRDAHFMGGVVRSRPAGLRILGTDDDELYLTQRRGDDPDAPDEFAYAIPVAGDGTYRVRLYFAEIYWGAPGGPPGAPGRRIFTVTAEGKRELVDYDIYADVGPMTAAVKQFEVEVQDGTLDLGFYGKRGQPVVAAIAVDRAPDG